MKARLLIVSLIIVTGMLIAGFVNVYYFSEEYRNPDNKLEVLNPTDINPILVDSSVAHIAEGHTIGSFSFINQEGDSITKDDVRGKIYVANFFFTTCGSICPQMTEQFARLQKEFKGDANFKLLSHTVNPSYDSVVVLKRYAERFGADPAQWWFLTGSKQSLYQMARKSYLVVPDENDPNFDHGGESDFIHTENFALIDPEGRIRGMYDGTNTDEISELIKDIYDLKREYSLP